jgi:DNA recombination protein RmuC
MMDFAVSAWMRLKDDPFALLFVFAGFAVLAFILLILLTVRQGALRAREERQRSERAKAAEAELLELKGRLAQMTEITALRQEELARTLNERLDRVGQQLGVSMEETGRRTSDHLAKLYERLAAVDAAQRTITELSGRVVSLQDVLANKQARGAFGQIRMEAIIEDALPKGAFSFQAALSNGKRPDCLIHLPHAAAGLVIDAKFPLEGFEALREAQSEAVQREAQALIRRDISKHIEDIAGKYFIPGETQDMALMFIPAESVYAALHESFPDLIQKAHRARIAIVSPNMLMLAVQTMMAILKDVRMREAADVIQCEVRLMLEDVARLRGRVLDFQRHFAQLSPDLEKILASADKIASRGARIESAGLEEQKEPDGALIPAAE